MSLHIDKQHKLTGKDDVANPTRKHRTALNGYQTRPKICANSAKDIVVDTRTVP